MKTNLSNFNGIIKILLYKEARFIPNRKKYFVVKYGSKWAVKSANSQRPSKVFETQAKAKKHVRTLATNNNSEVSIQKTNGQFGEKHSYGHDPKNIKG